MGIFNAHPEINVSKHHTRLGVLSHPLFPFYVHLQCIHAFAFKGAASHWFQLRSGLLWPSADMATELVDRPNGRHIQVLWLAGSVVLCQAIGRLQCPLDADNVTAFIDFWHPQWRARCCRGKKLLPADYRPTGSDTRRSHEHAGFCLSGSNPGLDTDRPVSQVQKVLGSSVSVWGELHRCHRRYSKPFDSKQRLSFREIPLTFYIQVPNAIILFNRPSSFGACHSTAT